MTWIHYISNYKWWPSICLFYIYVLLFALFFFLSFTTDDLDWFGVVSRWRLRSSWQLYILLQNMYRYIYIYKSIAGWTHTRNDMRKKKKKMRKSGEWRRRDMLARNSFFIGPLIGRDGCRPEVFFSGPLYLLFSFRSTRRVSGRYPPISNSSAI